MNSRLPCMTGTTICPAWTSRAFHLRKRSSISFHRSKGLVFSGHGGRFAGTGQRHRPASESPYSFQVSFNVRREIARNAVIEAGYLGAYGVHLEQNVQINNAEPGLGNPDPRRPYNSELFAPSLRFPREFTVISDRVPIGFVNFFPHWAHSTYVDISPYGAGPRRTALCVERQRNTVTISTRKSVRRSRQSTSVQPSALRGAALQTRWLQPKIDVNEKNTQLAWGAKSRWR